VSARVDAVLGDPFAPKSFSLIAIHKYELPNEFSDAVIEEAKRVAKQPLGEREDLTNLPIVAIDPADARDHDDAIWAAPDDDPDNKGGWKAIVAIADVSFYVRPGARSTSRRDRAATASISPTRWCRCCPRSCRPTSAR
jgi:ribonuclease R